VREILTFWVSTRQRQNDVNGACVTSSLQNPKLAEHEIFRTHVSARPLHDQIHRELVHRLLQFQKRSQLFMSPHDDPLFVAMRVLVALSAVVENGYDR
jgi:hypothetical protein